MTCLIAVGTPGPGTLAVINSSILHGVRKTVPLMAGIAIGLGSVSIFTILGLSHILTESQSAFIALQYLGIAYILLLGVKCVKQSFFSDTEGGSSIESKNLGLFSGIWISVLNPKTILFFVAFFPTYMTKYHDDAYFYLGLVLTVILIGCTFAVHITYSIMGQSLSVLLRGKVKEINLVTGILFVALAALMAF